jgi:casein kinase II subunit beta
MSVHEEEESFSEEASDDVAWIPWFCSLKGNDYFCEVDDEFIQDDFNLFGLSNLVDYYDQALDVILDAPMSEDLTPEEEEAIESAAEFLYGLIHARFITTARGMQAMEEKYKNADFGRCPRVFCAGQPVLPVGLADLPRQNTVKLFCPKCEDVYYPRASRHQMLDGACFGTSFPHMFFQQFPELVPPQPSEEYAPRIFGFKVHASARLHPDPDAEAAVAHAQPARSPANRGIFLTPSPMPPSSSSMVPGSMQNPASSRR